jgi:hypothetical protein
MIDLAAQTQLFNLRRTLAVFSDCEEHTECTVDACRGRRYRYQLWWPTGLDNDRMCLGIFANPSTATADKLDPTLTRWRNFCRDWDFGWSVTANVRAWRETDPKLLPPDPRAIGPRNHEHLGLLVSSAEVIVCGWGGLGGAMGQPTLDLIRAAGRVPYALKLNSDGSPSHPLFLSAKLKPFPIR